MKSPATSTSSARSTESAQARLRLWRARSSELLTDLEAFLTTSDGSCADSQAAPLTSLPPSDSQAA